MAENWPQISPDLLQALVDEVNDLRARLAEIEAERDTFEAAFDRAELAEARADRDQWQRDFQEQFDRAEAAEAKLAAVEALCDEKTARNLHSLYVNEVRAAVRGEGDRG